MGSASVSVSASVRARIRGWVALALALALALGLGSGVGFSIRASRPLCAVKSTRSSAGYPPLKRQGALKMGAAASKTHLVWVGVRGLGGVGVRVRVRVSGRIVHPYTHLC